MVGNQLLPFRVSLCVGDVFSIRTPFSWLIRHRQYFRCTFSHISEKCDRRESTASRVVRLVKKLIPFSPRILVSAHPNHEETGKAAHFALSNPPSLSCGFSPFCICLSLMTSSSAISMTRPNVSFADFSLGFALLGCVRKGILVA